MFQNESKIFELQTRVRSGNELSIQPVSLIALQKSTVIQEQDVFPNVQCGLCGRTLTMSTLPVESLMDIHTLDNGTLSYSGLCIDLLDILMEQLNFTYVIFFLKIYFEPPKFYHLISLFVFICQLVNNQKFKIVIVTG